MPGTLTGTHLVPECTPAQAMGAGLRVEPGVEEVAIEIGTGCCGGASKSAAAYLHSRDMPEWDRKVRLSPIAQADACTATEDAKKGHDGKGSVPAIASNIQHRDEGRLGLRLRQLLQPAAYQWHGWLQPPKQMTAIKYSQAL